MNAEVMRREAEKTCSHRPSTAESIIEQVCHRCTHVSHLYVFTKALYQYLEQDSALDLESVALGHKTKTNTGQQLIRNIFLPIFLSLSSQRGVRNIS